MHLLVHLLPCIKAANMTCKQSAPRTALLWLSRNLSSVSSSPLTWTYSLEMFWKNKAVTTTRSSQNSALRCRGGGTSGRSVAQRWGSPLPGLHPLLSGGRGEDVLGPQRWTLGKGKWQSPYLLVDVDAAGPKGGGPIARHVVVSRGLRWGLLQLPGHCGDGGDTISTPAP